jgi:hypothetical protein
VSRGGEPYNNGRYDDHTFAVWFFLDQSAIAVHDCWILAGVAEQNSVNSV